MDRVEAGDHFEEKPATSDYQAFDPQPRSRDTRRIDALIERTRRVFHTSDHFKRYAGVEYRKNLYERRQNEVYDDCYGGSRCDRKAEAIDE